MKKQLAICAGFLLLGLATAGAQAVYPGPGLPDRALPPYEIMSIVRSTGLAPLTRPMRRGPYYVLVAVDRIGRQMRVVVDAQLGDIVNLRPALAAGSYGPEPGRPELGRPEPGRPNGLPGVVAVPPDTTAAYGSHPSGDTPAPPRPIPNANISNPSIPNPSIPNSHAVNAPSTVAPPPTRLAVVEPTLPPPPPLPRPRPKLALNEAPGQAPAEAPAGAPAAKPPAPPAAAAPSSASEADKPIE